MTAGTEDLQSINRIIEESLAAKKRLLNDSETLSTIFRVTELLVSSLKEGHKLIVFGNGGSAADAQHIAAEFVGRFAFDRPALPAISLSVNTSCLTAIGNDYGFEVVFSRQIEALGQPGDVAIGITTSGNSPNVVCGLKAAAAAGIRTVCFTGQKGGRVKEVSEFCICAPSEQTPRIQECHILIGHIISELVEKALFDEKSHLPRP